MSVIAIGRRHHVKGPATRYGAAALASEVERNVIAPRGHRHSTLFSSACRIGELVGGGELSETLAVTALVEVGLLVKPEARSEIERTVQAGLDRGRQANPRSAPTTGSMLKDAQDARMRLLALVYQAGCDPERWSGPAGGSDLRVLVGILMIALHAGKLRIGVSYRQIAERSGVSLGTVVRALGALEGTWLRRTHLGSRNRRADRSVFQILAPGDWVAVLSAMTEQAGGNTDGKVRHCSLLAVDRKRLGEGLRDPGHPLWKRRSTAWRMWGALTDAAQPIAAGALAQTINAAPRTVWRNLAWLAGQGLVICDEQRWSAVEAREAVELVEHLEPQRELVRERHRIEREQHRIWLQERATARRREKGHVIGDDQVLALRQARARLSRRWVVHRSACRSFDASVTAVVARSTYRTPVPVRDRR